MRVDPRGENLEELRDLALAILGIGGFPDKSLPPIKFIQR
jgi:hypothetical protein